MITGTLIFFTIFEHLAVQSFSPQAERVEFCLDDLREGRSSPSRSIDSSCLSPESIFNFSSRFITVFRMDSDSRFGIQPNGPIAITPQVFDAISV